MNDIQLQAGPSSWDRDMQGLDIDAESENLAALGMHIAGTKDDENEEDLEEEAKGQKDKDEDDEDGDKDKDEPEELDELKELERLEKELKEEDPALLIDEEE
ncbi:MAG: hypothetical protein AAB668_01615 [Patescibacteria group bacterium]